MTQPLPPREPLVDESPGSSTPGAASGARNEASESRDVRELIRASSPSNKPAKRRRPQLHEQLLGLLPTAGGETPQVLVVFVDIRGFSTFSARVDSPEVALYLRSIFRTVLASYFPHSDFFKLTGDGLMIVYHLPSEPDGVRAALNLALRRSLRLVEEFGQLVGDDILVNISGKTPQFVGIGLARGSATRLVSGGLVLDYTGKCLNLAARLMEKARPSGVVFHDARASQLLDDEMVAFFGPDQIYVRGIAEEEPLSVLTSEDVELTRLDREPIRSKTELTWCEEPTLLSVAEVRQSSNFGFWLPRKPHSFERVAVRATWDIYNQYGKKTGRISHSDVDGVLEEDHNGHLVRIQLRPIQERVADLPMEVPGFFKPKQVMIRFRSYCKPVTDTTRRGR